MRGMSRVRISTTVDASALETCRALTEENDSILLDRALRLLRDHLEGELERAALGAQPYEDDPDLAWTGSTMPALAYDGEIPEHVIELARRRRST